MTKKLSFFAVNFGFLVVLISIVLLNFSVFAAQSVFAATIIVNSTADNLTTSDTFCTLREAIRNANIAAGGDLSGGDCVAGSAGADTITFNSSLDGSAIVLTMATTNENNSLNGDLDIRDNLTLTGNGSGSTIIDAAAIDRVFDIPVSGLSVTFSNMTIQNGAANSGAGDGGGISNNGSTITISNSLLSNNAAIDDGGGISNLSGTIKINDSILSGNRTTGPANTHGGAIRNDNSSTLIVNNTLFDGNLTVLDGSGGGIFNVNNSTMMVTNSSFNNNNVIDDGGGIYINSGSATIIGSVFYNNFANTDGGGLSNEGGSVTIMNSTFSGNSTNRNGAGLANHSSTAVMNLTHLTIINNIANLDGGAGDGGGLSHGNGATTNIANTIIINNDDTNSTTTDDCSVGGATTLTSGGYNMLANGTGCGSLSQPSDFTTTAPGLDVLQNNGGNTDTHALLGNSPAIDRIPNGLNGCGSTYTTDQREVTRPLDGNADSTDACDVGAYETGWLQCTIQSSAEPATYTFFTNVAIEIEVDGTDLDCLRVTQVPHNHPNATSGLQTGQFWIIEGLQSDQGTKATNDYTADLTLPHNIVPDTNATVCKWLEGIGPGAGWDCARTTSTATTVLRNAVPGFSDWAVGNNVTPTAVSLRSVTGKTAVPLVFLLWLTAMAWVSWHLAQVNRKQ